MADYQAELRAQRKFRNDAMKEAKRLDVKIDKLKADRIALLAVAVRARECLINTFYRDAGVVHQLNETIAQAEKGE